MRKLWHVGMAVTVLLAGYASGAEKVKRVSVRTQDTFGADESDVLWFCGVKAGDEFSQEAAARDVKALMDTGRFGYAGVQILPVSDGLEVVYVIQRRHRFQGPLAIKGASYLSESKLRKISELKNGDYIDDPILATRAGKIRDAYVKRYFRDVKVGFEMDPIEGRWGFAHVTFEIEEGERQKIRDFKFVGNTSIPSSELRSVFGGYSWWNPRGWFTDTPVSDLDLEEARQKAQDVYRDKGFLDAQVEFPVIENAGGKKVDMVFKVTEGGCYTVESIAVRGVTMFPEDMVLEGAGLKPDMPCGQKALTAAAKNIRDYYTARGYVDAMVRQLPVKPVPGQSGRTIITFDVYEGELAYVCRVIVRGNYKTRDTIIRREVQIHPGMVVDESRIVQSAKRLKNLGYFSVVRYSLEKTDNEDQRDVVFEVEEK